MLLLSALTYLASGFAGATLVPLSQPTGPSKRSYVAHSGRCSTIDILLSSVITLTLCVYTNIHLNITPPKKYFGIWNVLIYKFYWVLIAMFAPEFVLYATYLQWRNPRELCKMLKTLGGKPELHRKVVQEIVALVATATSWIVSILRRAPSNSPGMRTELEQLESSQSESKRSESVQQELVGSDSATIGSGQSDPILSDNAERRKSDQAELVPAVLDHPDPEQRTIQGLASTKPNTASPSSTPSPDVQADERWCKIWFPQFTL